MVLFFPFTFVSEFSSLEFAAEIIHNETLGNI
jgi:hypothetical protein